MPTYEAVPVAVAHAAPVILASAASVAHPVQPRREAGRVVGSSSDLDIGRVLQG